MEKHMLNFRASNGYPSRCQIQIYRQSQLVIATDIDEGMSRSADAVTNACEIIANQVVQQFGVKPQQLFFIEEYRPAGPNHTTDLVQFDFAGGKHGPTGRFKTPRWTHLPEEEFKQIIQLAEEIEKMV